MTLDNNFKTVDLDQYRVHSRREIIALLRSIEEHNQLVSLLIDGGSEAVVTSILTVDDVKNIVIVDSAPSKMLNERIANSNRISFETVLDHIRILFSVDRLQPCTYDKMSAFQFALPPNVIRLQRREFYRVATPVSNPVRCIIPMPNEAGDKITSVPVVLQNISAGGVAIVDEKKLLDNTSGCIYKNCRIDLPGGVLEIALQIRNFHDLTFASGKAVRRLGCMFVNISQAQLAAVQRYITKLEREQNARASGMK